MTSAKRTIFSRYSATIIVMVLMMLGLAHRAAAQNSSAAQPAHKAVVKATRIVVLTKDNRAIVMDGNGTCARASQETVDSVRTAAGERDVHGSNTLSLSQNRDMASLDQSPVLSSEFPIALHERR